MLRSGIRAIVAAILVTLAATGTAGAETLPFHPTSKQGVFLHVSDIHLDPFIDKTLLPRLVKAPVDRWEAIFQPSNNERFAQYGEDSNFPLFMAMLSAARGVRYDYVLNTGDNLAHDFREKYLAAGGQPNGYPEFVIKTLRFVNLMLTKSFPGAPLIYGLGNNDAVCGDYKVAPTSRMLAQAGRELPIVAGNRKALKSFVAGGYYVVPHPTVPRHDMIVLNSVFWSAKYHNECNAKAGNPGAAELAWLRKVIAREKRAKRTATLVMHIPPGINSFKSLQHTCTGGITTFWHDGDTRRFLALVERGKTVLRGSYAGHTHRDNFRVLSGKSGAPLLTTRITPSVSPVYHNNPSFTVLLYDRRDAAVKDYATFYLANLATAGPTVPPTWKLEYTFAETYDAAGYTPASIAALAKSLRSDASVRKTFLRHYAVEASSSPIKAGDWMSYACAQTAVTRAEFEACRCPGASPPQGTQAAPH